MQGAGLLQAASEQPRAQIAASEQPRAQMQQWARFPLCFHMCPRIFSD